MIPRLLIVTAVVLVAAASPAPAQSFDRGKDKLPKLFRQVAASAAESTVRIQADGKDAVLGTVISEDGLILTKGSELMKGTEKGTRLRGELSCKLPDGTAYDATCLGYHKETDLALLKVAVAGLKAVNFAASSEAEVGDWVAAPGPGADLLSAVGVVSAAVRKLSRGDETVIENANKGYLGIRLDKPKSGEGARVVRLDKDAGAARAGLKENDVICEVASKTIKTPEALIEMLDAYRPGDTITVRIKRGDEELSLKVKLVSRTDINRSDFQNSMGGSLSGRRTGFPAVIQHDTVVRPADCGGPLVDLDGNVVGINIARAGRVETWALPADVIAKAVKDLKSGKFPPPGK